jgi:hypothetical protein
VCCSKRVLIVSTIVAPLRERQKCAVEGRVLWAGITSPLEIGIAGAKIEGRSSLDIPQSKMCSS